jgi:hypothetical protein
MVNLWKQKKTLKSSLFLTLPSHCQKERKEKKMFEKNWRDCSRQQISNPS